MKRKSLLLVMFALLLPLSLLGQGCFIVGPGTGPDGAVTGDVRLSWILDVEGSCDAADTVEVTIRNGAGQVESRTTFDCEKFSSTLTGLPEGSYTTDVVGLDPTGAVVYQGSASFNIIAGTVTDVTVDLDPS
ncbi:MAG: hypothetical protein EP343_26370 [Deltaproteobacteria bacterium]|nr:MAG: hypothetical protein EP343_26370 [Deltaproteobacteria bacterium]